MMKVQIIIIVVILLVGVFLFSSNITNMFPNASVSLDSVIRDADNIQKNVTSSISTSINKSISSINEHIPDISTPDFLSGQGKNSISDKIYYKTLSLTMEKQKNNIIINYLDTLDSKQNVTITMRNDKKQYFSGDFSSSSFIVTVPDTANISQFIDLKVEHETYGTVLASAFYPLKGNSTIINGVFTFQ